MSSRPGFLFVARLIWIQYFGLNAPRQSCNLVTETLSDDLRSCSYQRERVTLLSPGIGVHPQVTQHERLLQQDRQLLPREGSKFVSRLVPRKDKLLRRWWCLQTDEEEEPTTAPSSTAEASGGFSMRKEGTRSNVHQRHIVMKLLNRVLTDMCVVALVEQWQYP
eukprot:1190355-Prorocentrum_minimum.AAC.6